MSHELGDPASELVSAGQSSLEAVRILEAASSAALYRLQARLDVN